MESKISNDESVSLAIRWKTVYINSVYKGYTKAKDTLTGKDQTKKAVKQDFKDAIPNLF